MTARKRGTSGRITPKGSKGSKKGSRDGDHIDPKLPTVPKLPPGKLVAKSQKWVRRPTTHNRGNR